MCKNKRTTIIKFNTPSPGLAPKSKVVSANANKSNVVTVMTGLSLVKSQFEFRTIKPTNRKIAEGAAKIKVNLAKLKSMIPKEPSILIHKLVLTVAEITIVQ